MIDTSTIISDALKLALEPGEAISPIEIAAELARSFRKVDDASYSPRALLFEGLRRVVSEANSSAITDDLSSSRLVGLSRWLHTTLSSWSGSENSGYGQLGAALIAIAHVGIDVEVLLNLYPAIAANSKLLTELATSTADLRANYSDLNSPNLPIWEREFAVQFILADEKKDWLAIAQAWPRLKFVSRSSPEVVIATRLLACANRALFVDALHSITQTVIAMQVMEALNPEQRMETSRLSNNPLIGFVSIYLTFNAGAKSEISDTCLAASADVLRNAADNIDIWRGWMSVFGRYPPRYSALQTSLGYALADVSIEAMSAYIETVALESRKKPNDRSRIAVATCLAAFSERASTLQRHTLWQIAFRRWELWDFDAENGSAHLFEIHWTDLDYAVYHYIVECMTDAERHEQQARIFHELSSITNRWHLSASHMTSEWFRLLSNLQPFLNAQAVKDGQQAIDDMTRAYMPSTLHSNRYLEIMFGTAVR